LRKQIRQIPNFLMNPRGLPHMGHRLYALTRNLGFLFTFCLSDVFANAFSLSLPGSLILERHPHQLEEFFSLFIALGCRHDADIQAFDFVNFIIVDFGEYQLFFDTQ
jgi:hypothetical protein